MLPTRLYEARTIRVLALNRILVDLSLGFGVRIQRSLQVEGIESSVPSAQYQSALHCLVIVLGARDLLVHTDDTMIDGHLKARVYLASPAENAPDGTVALPYGMDEPRMEIGLMWQWLQRTGFDPRETGRRMHGVPKGG
jgi:hypothetical protein